MSAFSRHSDLFLGSKNNSIGFSGVVIILNFIPTSDFTDNLNCWTT